MNDEKVKQLNKELVETINFYTAHLQDLRKMQDEIAPVVAGFKQLGLSLDLKDLEQILKQNGFQALLVIAFLDLAVICKSILSSTTDWEKRYFIKNAYLTLYETVQSYDSCNKAIQQWIPQENVALKESFLTIASRLKAYKKHYQYEGKMKLTRDKIAAHTDGDFSVYFDTLIAMNSDDAVAAITEFSEILSNFLILSQQLAEGLAKEIKGQDLTGKSI